MKTLSRFSILSLFFLTLFLSSCSDSSTSADEMVNYTLTLQPYAAGDGTGTATVKFNKTTRAIDYTVNWQLSAGDSLLALHFHGPSEQGVDAPIVQNIAYSAAHMVNSGTLSNKDVIPSEKVADLLAGKWYINIHSTKKPVGALRVWIK